MGALHLTKKTISKLDSRLIRGGETKNSEEGTSIWHLCVSEVSFCGCNTEPGDNCTSTVSAGCI